jgi:DNA sulfur modification protein DndD
VILNELTLTNFGIYKGEHTVELTPRSHKPIILFGAYNGSGKTTFLDALQLVLYGKAAKTSSRGKEPYEDYLKSLINRDTSPKVGASLRLRFTTKQNGKEELIEVSRNWFESNSSNIKEFCEIKREGIFDQTASERWHEFVEEFMPSEISELFFFDGEKIESLADPLRSSVILRNGIYSLLGINAIESLSKSLAQIEKRKAIEIAKDSGSISIEAEEALVKDLNSKKESLSQEIAGIKNQIDRLAISVTRVEEEMQISGGNLFVSRQTLKESLGIHKERRQGLINELLEVASGMAPLILVADQVEAVKEELRQFSGYNVKFAKILENEITVLKKQIDSSMELNKSIKEWMFQLFDARIDHFTAHASEYVVDIDESQIPSAVELDDLKKYIQSKLKEFEFVESEVDTLNKNLAAVPSEEKVGEIVKDLLDKQKAQAKLELKAEVLGEEIILINNQLERIAKEITSKLALIAELETSQIVNQRVLKHSHKAKNTLAQFKDELISKHLSSLSDEISKCFQVLHRKSKFGLKFEINNIDFSLLITKPSGTVVSAKSLSAGERQLLAVAMLWALAKSSGKTLPTVIDTPLGRLDGPHRQKLISNYFPNAGSQVLIFSTDEEITVEHYDSLKDHIALEYSINYDELTESSVFNSGYFDRAKVSHD